LEQAQQWLNHGGTIDDSIGTFRRRTGVAKAGDVTGKITEAALPEAEAY
jgi:hypothetical protein